MQTESLPIQNELTGELLAQVIQIALLNSKLPRGMRFEPIEKVEKPDLKKKSTKRAKAEKKLSDSADIPESSEKLSSQAINLAQTNPENNETQKDSNLPELSHRHSTREKKATAIEDLGYTNKEQLKKAGKGVSEAFKKCEKVLNQLRKHPLASHFLYPVTTPGYTDIVKEPLDLSIIEKRLNAGVYATTNQFATDVRKIWNNAWTFNKPGSEMYILTTKISENFETLMKEIDESQFSTGGSEEILELKKKVSKFTGVLKKIQEQSPAMASQKVSTPGNRRPPEKPMTPKEKAILGQNIRKLSQEQVLEMLQILRDVIDLSKAKDGLELDLEKLPARKCRELDQFVKKALNSGSKSSKAKKKPKTSESIPQETEGAAPQTVF